MNYYPFISWGVYGGSSPVERDGYFVSWGLWTLGAVDRGLRLVGSVWRGVIDTFGYWFC